MFYVLLKFMVLLLSFKEYHRPHDLLWAGIILISLEELQVKLDLGHKTLIIIFFGHWFSLCKRDTFARVTFYLTFS